MKTLLKIVAAVDRSPHALRVIRHAIDLAKLSNSELHFVFVKIPFGETFDKLTEDHRRHLVAEQLTALDAENVVVHHEVISAEVVAPSIVHYAGHIGANLIVMGSHGRRGFRKFIMGSVAMEVVRSAECPVYTVGGKDETDAGRNPMSQILVPYDFSGDSEQALEYAVSMATILNANIDVLHIVEDAFYPAFYGPFMHSVYESSPDIEQIARETLKRRIEETNFDLRRVDITVMPGHPGADISRYAEENAMDLIIMATHGLSGVRHLFMGSVAERTAQTAPCPVLTIRTREKFAESGEGELEAIS